MLVRVIMAIALIPSFAIAYDREAVNAQCAEDWGTDFSMVKYCREKQSAAGEAVDKLMERAASDPTTATILKACEADWGTDYSMVEYCLGKQESALRSLSNAGSDRPGDVAIQIRSDCAASWGSDFSMVSYCIEKQASAWKALQ